MSQLEEDFCNAIGFVVDKSIEPHRKLGQAFLVSKSRMVTNASQVFHYTEAPWAIEVHFPYPDVSYEIKSVNLHNDFDKVTARANYLATQGTPGERSQTFTNDIAMLVVDNNPPEVAQDKVAELNRAMSLPFSGEGVEASGNLRGAEFVQIITSALKSGREGLLSLYDQRNIPVAHVLLKHGGILKVFFRQVMSSEMAFCELVYRQPAMGFAFKPEGNIDWGEVPDVQTPPEQLINEAVRRSDELPNVFQQLGGPEARYQKVVQEFDPQAASEDIRWMVQPLWEGLDGYIALDKLAHRVGVDTYTVLIAIRELVNRGVITQINKVSPFPCTGQIGNPLISHTDYEVHPWDPLRAFYLDPLSGAPSWVEGNYFGVVNSLQPKNMLHTIPLPQNASGALILKDYKLIGIHSGQQDLKPGQPAPPVSCYQFMWMGALLDLSARKSKSIDEAEGEQGVGALRSMESTEKTETKDGKKRDQILCPNCFAVNHEYGECKTCGTDIPEPVEEEEESENAILNSKPAKEIKKLQKKYNISNAQLGAGVAVLCLPLFFLMFCSPKPPPPTQTNAPAPIARTKASDPKAVELAVDEAGFSSTAPPMYWYEDTTEATSPAPSFGLFSEQANQKMTFMIYNDLAPVKSLKDFFPKPPFTNVERSDLSHGLVDGGDQILGSGKVKWMLGKYTEPVEGAEPRQIQMMIASFPAAVEGKSILLVGKAFDTEKTYNHKTTLFVLDEIASELTAQANKDKLDKQDGEFVLENGEIQEDTEDGKKSYKISTEEEIEAFVERAQKTLQEKLELPEGAIKEAETYEEENGEPKKWSDPGLQVKINREGVIRGIQILPAEKPDKKTDKLNKALEKAVVKVASFENPPIVKKPEFQFKVRLKGTEIVVIPD